MPQLLQSVIYIIETFQNYAREEGDCWTLSSGQLKQLLLREIGEFLKPFDSLTTGTNLNLLDRDGDETISFDEFIPLVFDLLNICYQDIQSFLNLEPKAESDAEEELSGDMETCETSDYNQEEAGQGQYEQRLTGTESPSLVNPIEKGPDTLIKEDPQDDLETPRLLGREAEYIHPKSQSQGEGDKQSPERTRIQATGGDRVPTEEKRPLKELVKRTCSQKEEKVVREERDMSRKQDGMNTRDQPSGQEGKQNMEIQSVHTEERAWKTSESQEGTIIKEGGEHTETQEPSSQENHERESETADLSTERAKEKLSESKRLPDYRDDVGTPDIKEPQVQRKYKTQDVLAKSNDSRVPGVLVDEKKRKRKPENSETAGQKRNEEDNQMEIFTEQEPDGKEKQLEVLTEEGDTGKDSVTPDLKSGLNQNHPEHKGPAASEEDVTVSELSEPTFSGDNRSASVAERTSETKDNIQGSGLQDNQRGGKSGQITQTLDQSTEQYGGHKVENQNDETLSETYNNPGDDESGSEPRDLPAQRNYQRLVDAQEQPDPEDGKNPQESPVLGDKSRTPETKVPIGREQSENTTEELKKITKEKEKKSSVAKTSVTTEESESQPGAQESMKQKDTAMSPKSKVTDENDGQLSIVQQSEKEDQGKDPEFHSPDAKEDREESESQEARIEGQDPETQDLTLDSSQEEHLSQSDTAQAYGPELRAERKPQRSKMSKCPDLLNPPCGYRQEPIHQVGAPEPDEEYGSQQETLASHPQEDGQPQKEDQQQKKGGSPKKC